VTIDLAAELPPFPTMPAIPAVLEERASLLAAFAARGVNAQFALNEDATVHCYTCNTDSSLRVVPVDSLRRMTVSAGAVVSCPRCTNTGVLVFDCGSDAGHDDLTALEAIEERLAGRARR
jgi:hypothetical protein